MSRRKHRKVAVVGNRSIVLTPPIAAQIVELLREYPAGTVFLTRGSPGIDQFILAVAPAIGYRCFAYPSTGGADNFNRDVEIVRDADEVIALLDPNSLDDPTTGTAHVLEKALDQHKVVRAVSPIGDQLVFVGALP